jgi:cell division protease FtsH
MMESLNYSEDVAKQIDTEIGKLIDEAAKRAGEAITSNREVVNRIAERLIEVETIDAADFEKLVGFPKKRPPKADRRPSNSEPQDIGPIAGEASAA